MFITDYLPEQTEQFQQLEIQDFDFIKFYKHLGTATVKNFFLITEKPKQLFREIKENLVLIKAAGGLVKNSEGGYLFIFRNKRWDLPKGKLEKGEKMKETALREVEEECGVTIQTNNEKICRTYHIYEMGQKIVLKKTNWYDMTVKGVPKLVPQKEEGITKAEWLNKNDLPKVLENTYPLILDVLKAGDLL